MLVFRQNEERANALATSHEVQRFHRDADETIDWIAEKDSALDNENVGADLPGVQRLQRKHDGLERDLHAIDEKVRKRGRGRTLAFRPPSAFFPLSAFPPPSTFPPLSAFSPLCGLAEVDGRFCCISGEAAGRGSAGSDGQTP